jgi:hypothetical protein
MPYRNLRRSCAGCFVLFLFALIVIVILSCLLGITFGRWFTPAAGAAQMGERQVVLLAPEISAAPERATPFGEFFSNQVTVEIAPGIVLLSSTADGAGALMTDDQATIQVTRADGSRREWAHDFRANNRSGIAPLPAQNITALFQPGSNLVHIVLRDVMPNTYSSLPYYLIFTAPVPPTRTTLPTSSPTVLILPPPLTPTRVSMPSVERGVSATSTATASPSITVPTPGLAMAKPNTASAPDIFPSVALGGGILLAGIIPLVLVIRQRVHTAPANQPPASFGWLNLYDAQTRESYPAIDLAQYPHGLVIHLDPLRVDAPGNPAQCLVAIRPSEAGMILLANNVPVINALGWNSDLETEMFSATPGQVLRDGMQLVIAARLELEYRNPRATDRVDSTGLGGSGV